MQIPGPLTDLWNQRLWRCGPGTSNLLGMRTPMPVKPHVGDLGDLEIQKFQKCTVSALSSPLKWGNKKNHL